jgi:hypothetical protein
MRKERHEAISPLVWLIFPIVSYLFLYSVMLTGFPSPVARLLGSEQGVLENAQVVLLLLFIGVGSKILWRKTPLPHPHLRIWIMLLIAGGLYTLVEEISWGQHYFGWPTPSWIADLNSQDQTNLHNVDGEIFYQIPRVLVMYLPYNLLLAAIYGGGLVYPLWTRGRRPSWYWPTSAGIVWAALTACASLPLTVAAWLNHPMPARHGELQEYFMYGFLFTYLYSLHHRLRASQHDPSQTPA